MPKFFHISSAALPLLAAVLVLALSAGYFTLAWTEPSGAMPQSVAAPITAGSTAQTKAGTLRLLNGNLQVDNGEFQSWGNIVIHPDTDSSGDDAVRFTDSAGTETLRINTDGRVGIGNLTSPKAKLSLSGATNGEAIGFDPYTYFGSEYSSANLSLGHFVRPRPGALGYIKSTGISVSGSSAAEFGNDIILATKGADSDAEGTAWDMASNAKLTVKNNGDVLITRNLFVGGNINATGTINSATALCVNSVCASSTAWNAMVSGEGGGNTFTAAPVITFSDGFEDNTLSPFTTDKSGIVTGDGLWKVTSADKNSGTYSAVAGQAGRDDGGGDYSSGISNLYLSNINVGPGGATISFSVKVNNWRASLTFTDGHQTVVFKGDDCNNPSSCPWQSGWYRATYSLSQGSYNFKWAYAAKNGLANRAFIDDIEIKENGTAINVTGNIELNGHLINSSPRDCYWGNQEINGEDKTMACKPGYFINGFRHDTETAGSSGDWRVEDLYCCRP